MADAARRAQRAAMIEVDIEQRLGAFALRVAFDAAAPVIGLFGRSGSGKTSVVNAIAGITRPDRGHVRINGTMLFDAAAGIDVPPERRGIGYVFQDSLLFPHLSVGRNLVYGQRLRKPGEQFIDRNRVVELLGLGPLLDRSPSTLSGGEKQRVAIGRALLAQPRILLMDEPLAALDVPRRTEVLDYIERLRDDLRIPIVYVSHSVPEIARIADTVVVLSEGTCLATGNVDEVLGRLDLRPATGRYEAGALLDTRAVAHDVHDQLTTLSFEGGELYVPQLDVPIGERVRTRIRARDVSLATQRPQAASILNVLQGTITAISEEHGAVVDVQLAVGAARLTARITRRSLRELALREGDGVFALIKAVAFDRRSVGYA
jgi:molybdate transport system ATP-binding protein